MTVSSYYEHLSFGGHTKKKHSFAETLKMYSNNGSVLLDFYLTVNVPTATNNSPEVFAAFSFFVMYSFKIYSFVPVLAQATTIQTTAICN